MRAHLKHLTNFFFATFGVYVLHTNSPSARKMPRKKYMFFPVAPEKNFAFPTDVHDSGRLFVCACLPVCIGVQNDFGFSALVSVHTFLAKHSLLVCVRLYIGSPSSIQNIIELHAISFQRDKVTCS